MEDTKVKRNCAGNDSGGLFNDGGTTNLTNVDIANNSPNNCSGAKC